MPGRPLSLLMLAAENGALSGGKVGGIGDVLRDLPPALAALGHRVTVILPGYGRFATLPGAREEARVRCDFRGKPQTLSLHSVPLATGEDVRVLVLEHPAFAIAGPGRIYLDDGPGRPFASDAGKFALFCAGVAAALQQGALAQPDVVHLHDWHSALFALLCRRHPGYRDLNELPLVYTIHNLALQGTRPLRGDESALLSWFPEMTQAGRALPPEAIDPAYTDCVNPMRAAITLCDRVHAVSPRYAEEICDPASGMGCGLQGDLANARDAGRLHGILNGCEYPEPRAAPPAFETLLTLARDEVERWVGAKDSVAGCDLLALRALDRRLSTAATRPTALLTSVGRLTTQKLGLLCTPMADGRLCLEHLLDRLGEQELCIMLGSGDPALESQVSAVAARRRELLFLRGYSDTLSDALYGAGDLFLMPSIFEPCGISQMLAMRAGQPCLVNAVGGLVDTVEDGVTGFVFRAGDGAGLRRGAEALLQRLDDALHCLRESPDTYSRLRQAAARKRFSWEDSARACETRLYRPLLGEHRPGSGARN
jgi:starch synthase